MNNFALPPLYRRWADEILKQDIYSEPRSTCDNCPMCKNVHPLAKQDYHFNPETKCCAFQPSLPNYLVGAILADGDPSLNKAKEQFLTLVGQYSFTPLGIAPPLATSFIFKIRPFGKDKELRCPFYLYDSGGLCGIWKYRNATCSTYFCKHERGVIGFRFWRKLEDTLLAAEKKLSFHCVMKLEVIIPETVSDLRERTWGNWTFREAEFFINCWNIVQPLRWEDVVKIGGLELEALVDELKNRFDNFQSKSLPEILRIRKFKSEQVTEELTRIWSYGFSDPIDLPTNIVQVLVYFDGRSTSYVLEQIKSEKGITIDLDLLQKLSDYEILAPPR